MRKLKLKFEYQNEIQIRSDEPDEVKAFEESIGTKINVKNVQWAINNLFLFNDGRLESGRINRLSCEVEND